MFSLDFKRYPALERLFNSFLIELVDSLNSFARPFRYPLLAALTKNLISILSLVLDVINEPNIILADEPTGNLDPDLSARVMRMFTQFQQLGVTVLIATHEKGVIDALPYRKIVIENGRLVDGGHDHFLDLEK